MKKNIITLAVSSLVLLAMSFIMLRISLYLFPDISMQYLSPVFRSSGNMNWMYYSHPVIISAALFWFWTRYNSYFKSQYILKALEMSLVYCVVAMIPVLWLTFSAIDVSLSMIATWMLYGFIQSFCAGLVFAWVYR